MRVDFDPLSLIKQTTKSKLKLSQKLLMVRYFRQGTAMNSGCRDLIAEQEPFLYMPGYLKSLTSNLPYSSSRRLIFSARAAASGSLAASRLSSYLR